MYKSENEFRKAIEKVFACEGWFTQKIESSGMNTGIPDLFVQKDRRSVWIELKLEKHSGPKQGESIKVAWRPGQQSWHKLYYMSKPELPVITVVQYSDDTILIPGVEIFKGRIVPSDKYKRLTSPLQIPSIIECMYPFN